MKIGTKSLLFGVHQFFWHPLTVWIAWVRLYERYPDWAESMAIFWHDAAYWGLPNIDGPEGKTHPEKGAKIARLFGGLRAEKLALYHSRTTAKAYGQPPSRLCAPDKLSILVEPAWFYLLRARLSGEAEEFRDNAVLAGQIPASASVDEWYVYYKSFVEREFSPI